MGKGSKRRPEDTKKVDENWKKTFTPHITDGTAEQRQKEYLDNFCNTSYGK